MSTDKNHELMAQFEQKLRDKMLRNDKETQRLKPTKGTNFKESVQTIYKIDQAKKEKEQMIKLTSKNEEPIDIQVDDMDSQQQKQVLDSLWVLYRHCKDYIDPEEISKLANEIYKMYIMNREFEGV